MEKEKHNFGEKEFETGKNKQGEWVDLEVWQSPKYRESKEKAIEMIDSKKYDLTDGDFWILKNQTKNDKMAYTGLIISHNGCLKINDKEDNKVDPKCFHLDKEGYNNSLVYTYIDDDTYEVGEFSKDNGKNAYPYAMAFKRCFDRVVLKKSKLAYSGIYSEAEADEFKETPDESRTNEEKKLKEVNDIIKDTKLHDELESTLYKLVETSKKDKDSDNLYNVICDLYKVEDLHLMTNNQIKNAIQNFGKIEERVGK